MDNSGVPETVDVSAAEIGREPRPRVRDGWWYALAFVSYALLGVWHKWLLNWFVGPLWLVVTVWAGPEVGAFARRLLRHRPGRHRPSRHGPGREAAPPRSDAAEVAS